MHIKCKKRATVHQSQLHDKVKEVESLKNELAMIKSELEQVKRQPRKSELPAASNDKNKRELKLLLDEKESKIQEYLEIINERDTQISSQRPCCRVCMTDLDETKQWIAFYKCGHRSCSECYDDLPLTAQNTKLCPICSTVISVFVPLAET